MLAVELVVLEMIIIVTIGLWYYSHLQWFKGCLPDYEQVWMEGRAG